MKYFRITIVFLLGLSSYVYSAKSPEHELVQDQNAGEVNLVEIKPLEPTFFTVVNSHIGRKWTQLKYREKYQEKILDAPCNTFKLRVPEERSNDSKLTLCIYRRQLAVQEDSFIHHDSHRKSSKDKHKVYGYVKEYEVSHVKGIVVDGYFYGKVAYLNNQEEEIDYYVEEIKNFKKLVDKEMTIANNIFTVVEDGKKEALKYNAIVTKGTSIRNYLSKTSKKDKGNIFIIVSTKHASYLTSGISTMKIEDDGGIVLTADNNDIVSIKMDGSVALTRRSGKTTKGYLYRPRERSNVQEGLEVKILEEREGSIAVSALMPSFTYSCILPPHSFREKSRKGGFLCKVCLFADITFEEHFSPNSDLATILGNMIDQISWIFRSTDWNDDGHPDNIGLENDFSYDFWTHSLVNITTTDALNSSISEEDLESLYKNLSEKDFTRCCLGIGFTMLEFPEQTYAKVSHSNDLKEGGICGFRREGVSHNVILLSGNNKTGNEASLTEDQLTFLTAFEIAKAFGAKPDGTGLEKCDQFTNSEGHIRHFMLWPSFLRERTPEEKVFSPCSKEEIKRSLSNCKTSCFIQDELPFCGNGIIEDGEECDCGSEYNCSKQLCCFARSGKHPCQKTGAPCPTSSASAIVFLSKSLPLYAGLLMLLA